MQLKLRSQVTTEQEKLLGEKGRDLEEMKKELENTKTTLRQKEDEVGERRRDRGWAARGEDLWIEVCNNVARIAFTLGCCISLVKYNAFDCEDPVY